MKKIYAFRNYFNDFKNALSEGERKKVMRALLLLETEDRVPYHYIKYLKEGVFELRVNYGNNEFKGYPIFTQLFNDIRKNIIKYYEEYLYE